MRNPTGGDGLEGLVDFAVLDRWMDDQGLPAGAITGIERLAGGTQNILVRFQRGGRDYVLRRPPVHLRKASNEVLRREARAGGAGRKRRAPSRPDRRRDRHRRHGRRLLPDGARRRVQPHRRAARAVHDRRHVASRPGTGRGRRHRRPRRGGPRGRRARRPRQARRVPGAAGAALARRAGDLRRARRLSRARDPATRRRRRLARPQPAHVVAARASSTATTTWPTSCSATTGPSWPRSSTGRCARSATRCSTSGGCCRCGPARRAPAPVPRSGWPSSPPTSPRPTSSSRDTRARSARDLSAIDWYTVLACFKLGIVLEGTHARACAGKADKGVGDLLHATTLALFAKAARLI